MSNQNQITISLVTISIWESGIVKSIVIYLWVCRYIKGRMRFKSFNYSQQWRNHPHHLSHFLRSLSMHQNIFLVNASDKVKDSISSKDIDLVLNLFHTGVIPFWKVYFRFAIGIYVDLPSERFYCYQIEEYSARLICIFLPNYH